ncbi:MAG: hypothetical protein Q8P41_12370 [Pseudomonadota bacterium]|nr:hypothetical protein [Pseudomonadota bacterium]
MPAAARTLLGLALTLALAAAIVPLVGELDDHVRVLILCILAALVAVGRALRPASGAATSVALGTLIALATVRYTGPWSTWFAGGAGVFGVLGLLAWRLGGRAVAMVAAVALMIAMTQVPPGERLPKVHTWNQFHYVLGTKYFDEVGYDDLYVAALLADEDGAHHFAGVSKLRDMHTYQSVSRADALERARAEGLRARFTDARWEEFQHDLDVFYPMFAKETWPSLFTDLGYNPSPVWVVLHRPLLQAITLDRRAIGGLAALQIPMYVGVVVAAVWAFGLRATLWITLWNLLFFGSRGRLYGGYWSYDWLALVVLSSVLVAKARPALAAVPVAIGGLMRGFGGLLAIGPAVHAVVGLVRARRPDPWAVRFLVSLAGMMLILAAVSMTTARGAGAWTDWIEKITFHAARVSTGGRHLGLQVLFGEDWSTPGHTADLDLRRTIYAGQAWAYHLVQAVLVGWTALILPRRSRLDAALLGLIPAFALMVLSRYYYAAWSVLLMLGTDERHREGRLPVQLGMLSVLALHEGLFLVDGTTPDSRHQDVNVLLLCLAVGTLAVYTVRDLRAQAVGRPAGLADPSTEPGQAHTS